MPRDHHRPAGRADLVAGRAVLQQTHHPCRECVGVVGQQDVDAILHVEPFSPDLSRDHCLLHGPGFEDLLAHAGPEQKRDDHDGRPGEVRSHIGHGAGDHHTGPGSKPPDLRLGVSAHDPEFGLGDGGLNSGQNLGGEESRCRYVGRMGHESGEHDPSRRLRDVRHGGEVPRVDGNRHCHATGGSVVLLDVCRVRCRHCHNDVVRAAVVPLEPSVPPGLNQQNEAIAERRRRPRLALVQPCPYIMHYQHADRSTRQVIEPPCRATLDHHRHLPGFRDQRLEKAGGDVTELQILR